MPDKSWKKQERRIAKLFGTRRTPLSGYLSLHTKSDIIHDKLFVECKYRSAGFSLIKAFKKKMKKGLINLMLIEW